jgi:hypothetical protein
MDFRGLSIGGLEIRHNVAEHISDSTAEQRKQDDDDQSYE